MFSSFAVDAQFNRGELIEQQMEILRDLDPGVRGGAAEVIRRLARAAQGRFAAGSTAAACAPACLPIDAGDIADAADTCHAAGAAGASDTAPAASKRTRTAARRC